MLRSYILYRERRRERCTQSASTSPPPSPLTAIKEPEREKWLAVGPVGLSGCFERSLWCCVSMCTHKSRSGAWTPLLAKKNPTHSTQIAFFPPLYLPSGHKYFLVFIHIPYSHCLCSSSSSVPLPSRLLPAFLIVSHWYNFCPLWPTTTWVYFPQAKSGRCIFHWPHVTSALWALFCYLLCVSVNKTKEMRGWAQVTLPHMSHESSWWNESNLQFVLHPYHEPTSHLQPHIIFDCILDSEHCSHMWKCIMTPGSSYCSNIEF